MSDFEYAAEEYRGFRFRWGGWRENYPGRATWSGYWSPEREGVLLSIEVADTMVEGCKESAKAEALDRSHWFIDWFLDAWNPNDTLDEKMARFKKP